METYAETYIFLLFNDSLSLSLSPRLPPLQLPLLFNGIIDQFCPLPHHSAPERQMQMASRVLKKEKKEGGEKKRDDGG